LGINQIIALFACITVFLLIGKTFLIPIKKILKFIVNSIMGGILIYIINLIGKIFCFHIGLNWVTSVFVGIFGVPGVILLVVLKLLI